MVFYDNLLRQCKLAGVSPSAVLDEIEMSRGNLNSWKKGGEPGLVTAQKIAQVLSIPVTLLLDEDDAKKQPRFFCISRVDLRNFPTGCNGLWMRKD